MKVRDMVGCGVPLLYKKDPGFGRDDSRLPLVRSSGAG